MLQHLHPSPLFGSLLNFPFHSISIPLHSISISFCPAGPANWFHLPFTSGCYGVFRTPAAGSWYVAREHCSQFGAHLASINSWQEMVFLANLISHGQEQPFSGLFDMRSQDDDMFYIGLRPTGEIFCCWSLFVVGMSILLELY